MDVAEDGGLAPGYTLKLNSYDLGVDIELADAVQRLRFEHPEVGAVVITSAKPRVFCAGANIQMLGLVDPRRQGELLQVHQRDAARHRGREREFAPGLYLRHQRHLRRRRLRAGAGGRQDHAVRRRLLDRVAAGGAAARRAARHRRAHAALVDKRKVRRDHADFFCTSTEGMRGERAVEWRLVDELVPRSRFDEAVRERARELAARDRSARAHGEIALALGRRSSDASSTYVTWTMDRERGVARDHGARARCRSRPISPASTPTGAAFWPLAVARELDDAVLRPARQRARARHLGVPADRGRRRSACSPRTRCWRRTPTTGWCARSRCTCKRVLKRIDLSARTYLRAGRAGKLLRRHAGSSWCSPPTVPTCWTAARGSTQPRRCSCPP